MFIRNSGFDGRKMLFIVAVSTPFTSAQMTPVDLNSSEPSIYSTLPEGKHFGLGVVIGIVLAILLSIFALVVLIYLIQRKLKGSLKQEDEAGNTTEVESRPASFSDSPLRSHIDEYSSIKLREVPKGEEDVEIIEITDEHIEEIEPKPTEHSQALGNAVN